MSDRPDHEAFEGAVRTILAGIGEDPDRQGLRETPERVRRMFEQMTEGYRTDPDSILEGARFDVDYDEMVVVRDIELYSLCEHHLVPFFGHAHVGYLPGERIVGLSKLARVVDFYARSLQVQERLTTQIARWLEDELSPKGVGVVLEAEHACMALRGVQKSGATTVTSALYGVVRDDQRTRGEFLSLTRRHD